MWTGCQPNARVEGTHHKTDSQWKTRTSTAESVLDVTGQTLAGADGVRRSVLLASPAPKMAFESAHIASRPTMSMMPCRRHALVSHAPHGAGTSVQPAAHGPLSAGGLVSDDAQITIFNAPSDLEIQTAFLPY